MGWPKPPPCPWGWSGHPKKKKKKTKKWVCWTWGWPDHPQGHGGGRSHHLRPGRGCPKPPLGPRGWSGHPHVQQTHFFVFFFFFFFLGLLGWPDHPQGHGGGFGHPIPAVGGGWSHPQPPPISPFFF
jgi:hypothetical protein